MFYFVKKIYLKHLQHTTIRTMICSTRSLSYGRNLPEISFLRSKESEKRWQHLKYQRANFHNTQKLQLSIYGVEGICFAMKLCSIFSGHHTRRWWLSLNPIQQQEIKAWYWKRRNVFYGSLSIFFLVLLMYYLTHLERDPIEKRRRFIIFNKSQQADFEDRYLTLVFKNEIIPPHDPVYRKIERVLWKLTNSNKKIFEDRAWSITVVDLPFPTAMVTPRGQIIVCSGIFKVVQNEDQLTFILAHEMSHVLLLHMIERYSYKVLMTAVFVIPLFLMWACHSSWKAILLYLETNFLYNVFLSLPYMRRKEMEADIVGLQLSARSCINLKEVLTFWKNMKKYLDLTGQSKYEMPTFLMTHPNIKSRMEELVRQMPKAVDLQNQVGCPNSSIIRAAEKFALN